MEDRRDILSAQGVNTFLEVPSSATILVHNALTSTNEVAQKLALSGAQHGTVVIADEQTAGRGRFGRTFHSPPGCGLYMSFLLRFEQYQLKTPTLFTALAALAVCRTIENVCGKMAGIKWVNDVLLDGKKVCGILTETILNPANDMCAVVGIGINIRTRAMEFPQELREIAGSLFPDGGGPPRNRIAAEIINQMLVHGTQLSSGELIAQYKTRLMMLGESIVVTSPQERYQALAVDVDEVGRLLVKREDGTCEVLSAGEITLHR